MGLDLAHPTRRAAEICKHDQTLSVCPTIADLVVIVGQTTIGEQPA